MIKTNKGAALFIDYGHEVSGAGETLQAVYQHQPCGVFEHLGDADLTAHVDFQAVREASALYCHGVVEQGEFFKTVGG